MPEIRPREPEKRIRELEMEVRFLSEQLAELRADREAHRQRGRRSTDPSPAPSPLPGRVASARLFLLFMTAGIAAAAWCTVSWANLIAPADFAGWQNLLQNEIGYRLVGVTVCGLIAILFYTANRWFLALSFALATVYLTFGFFFLAKPVAIALPTDTYTAISLAALTVVYLAFCDLCVRESRRFARGRRRPAILATANSIAFYVFVWRAVQGVAPEWAWIPYATLGFVALLFARHAETTGAHRNYIVRLFVVKAVVLFNVALVLALPGERLLIALGLECLLLAATYRATGIVIVKVMNILVMAVTTILCIDATKITRTMFIAGHEIPVNWLVATTVSALFLATACFYERLVRGVRPQNRRVSGHWYLADTALDVPKAVASVLHATGAALILLMLIIAELGDHAELPYVLACASVILAVAGFALRTPQLEVSAVMLIVAAHVGFYFFLVMGKPGFADQPYFVPATIGVAVYTFFGAIRWERFLERFRAASSGEYYTSAAAPYAVCTLMLATLFRATLPVDDAIFAQCAVGIGTLLFGAFFRRGSWKGAALVPIGAATLGLALILRREATLTPSSLLAAISCLLLTYVLAERILAWKEVEDLPFAYVSRRVRTMFVLTGAGIAFASIFSITDNSSQLLLWLSLAAAFSFFGAITREGRYLWTSAILLCIPLPLEFVLERAFSTASIADALAALAIVILSWRISRRPKNDNIHPPADPGLTESARHG